MAGTVVDVPTGRSDSMFQMRTTATPIGTVVPAAIGFRTTSSTGRLAGMFDRITFDPAVMGGRACIRGMRITVALVVNLVANGMSTDDIIREYPELESEDIRQSLQYASALANEEIGFFKSPAA